MKKFISVLSALVILFSFSACTTMKPVEGYEDYREETDSLLNERTTAEEVRDYTEGWPAEIRKYISVYLSSGEYVRTATNETPNGTAYSMLYNDVARDDAIAYGREVGIWEEDWTKNKDNSITVYDKHYAFSIALTHLSEPKDGYNFKITVKIYNESVKATANNATTAGGAS